jgi:hypothetical protein
VVFNSEDFGYWKTEACGILLLLRLILLIFSMLILRLWGLTRRALVVLIIFSDLLLFVGLLANSLLLHSPPPRPSM